MAAKRWTENWATLLHFRTMSPVREQVEFLPHPLQFRSFRRQSLQPNHWQNKRNRKNTEL